MMGLTTMFKRIFAKPDATIVRDQALIRETSELRIRRRAAHAAREASRERIDQLFENTLQEVRGKAP